MKLRLMNKELFEKLNLFRDAEQNVRLKYLEYIAAIRHQREIAEDIVRITGDFIKMPHIDVKDFEIDG